MFYSNNRRQFIQASTALSAWGASTLVGLPAFAQTSGLPLEQVKIINGFPVGGSADTTSRRIGEKLGPSAYTKNAALVENKTGAAARIAIDAVKAAAPDGTTLLLTPYSMMAIYPHIYKQLSYDPVKDLMLGVHGLIADAWPGSRSLVPQTVKTVKDFLAWAKANPKDASYASPAAGSTPHFLGALLGINNGIELKHIPYRGSAPGVMDVVGGQIASMFTPHGDFLAQYKAGKLRILATSGTRRSIFAPDVPTFIESGFPDLVVEEWFGFYAPAKTPANIIASANAAINAALKEKSVIDSLAIQGLLPVGGTPEQMAADQKIQFDRWGPIVKKIGFTAEA